MEGHHLDLTQELVLIGALGIGAQWAAWTLRLPGIVLLVAAGLLVGPVLGIVDPARDFGGLLRPFVHVAVALILFEGGLTLHYHEFRAAAAGVRRLVTVGAVLGFVFAALAARYVAGLPWPVALVLGAILVVTGPTVIVPLLRQARLARRPASFLKWEGIINDPTGAILAVLLFELFTRTGLGLPQAEGGLAGQTGLLREVLLSLGLALVVAVALGLGVGWALRLAFRRGWVPSFLKPAVVFGSALLVFGLDNLVLEESGLVAATVLGIVIGNTRDVGGIREVRRFKEYLAVLLVSGIFVVLTASLRLEDLARLGWRELAFVLVMLVVVRPLTVTLATWGNHLTRQERLLVGWIAPRGVVAASVAGFFGPELARRGYPGAELLVPLVFAMVLATVVLHGFSLPWLARRLGLGGAGEGSLLIVGASNWSLDLARTLQKADVPVVLSDSYPRPLRPAQRAGIPTYEGEILAGDVHEELDVGGIGYVLAATRDDPYNALVCAHFAAELGHERTLQLPLHGADHTDPGALDPEARGRIAFPEDLTFEDLEARHRQGWRFAATRLAENEPEGRDEKSEPLLLVRASGVVVPSTADAFASPRAGDLLVTLAAPKAAGAVKGGPYEARTPASAGA